MFEKNVPMRQTKIPELHPRLLSHKSFLDEMSKPASRFKQPLDVIERARLAFAKHLTLFSPNAGAPLYVPTGIPLNWQLVLNYLYKAGIIESPKLSPILGRNDKPELQQIVLTPHHNPELTDAPSYRFSGHGSARDIDERFSKAVGELLERYFGTVYKQEELYRASTHQLLVSSKNFLPPDTCSQFAAWQKERFADFRFDENTLFHWLEAEEIVSRSRVLVPAQLMFWNYSRRKSKEPLLMPMTSNGMAGHFSRTEAIIVAVRECIERDAFLVYWMNTLSPRVVAIEKCEDEEVREMLQYLARFRMKPYLLNTTTDVGIPTSACVLISDEEGDPLISVGAAAGRSARDSFLSACREAIAVHSQAAGKRQSVRFDAAKDAPFSRTDIGMHERICLWNGRDMYDHMRFFISGDQQSFADFAASFPTYESPKEEIAAIIARFRDLGPGYEIYVREARHAVLETLGYHVVKVFVPQLLPMHMNEHEAALGAARLRDVPARLKYPHAKLNTLPHPFP